MAEQANWYVAHTYSGYENKVATDLMTMVENRHLHCYFFVTKIITNFETHHILQRFILFFL